MSPSFSNTPAARIRHLTPNPRLHLQFFRVPPPSPPLQSTTQPPQRSRSLSTSTVYRAPWTGRPASENAGTDTPTEKHNVQHDQSQAAKKERATGEGGSVSVNEKGGKEVKEAKKKVSFEFPKGAKLGPVIGMEDERGGKGT